jgi:signal transduction histidine kinase
MESPMLAPFRSRALITYGVAAVSIAIAWAARYAVDPILGDHASFSIFFLAVSVAAWLGGFWPAIVTALVGCLVGNFFFTHPYGSFAISTLEELYSLLLFLTVSVIIGILSEISLRALERARSAERAKDDFMATVAHELRSPLSVIHYANALNRMSGAEESRAQVDLIESQVKQLDVLIRDLLDLSRVTHGKIRLDRQHVDASVVIERAIEKAKPLIARHKHALHVEIPSEPMPLYVDPVRLDQVLGNLLTNAAKYTPDGGEIDVRVEIVGDNAVFIVRDNGIGISEDTLPSVFELFVQAEPASKRANDGLGIGLALVKKLVEMHGGSVSATSGGLNQGSEFVVSLPLTQAAATRATLVNA